MFVYVWWCPTHTVLCFSFDVRRHMYPMLQVTLDCQYLIAPSVFFKSLFYSKYVNRVVGGFFSLCIQLQTVIRKMTDDVLQVNYWLISQ